MMPNLTKNILLSFGDGWSEVIFNDYKYKKLCLPNCTIISSVDVLFWRKERVYNLIRVTPLQKLVVGAD